MAYATVEDLAYAVRTRVTDANRDYLQRCVDSASEEIDAFLDRFVDEDLPEPAPAVITSTCVARGVEWYKANDAAFGVVGYTETGALRAPRDSFERHAIAIGAWKQQFGLA